MKKKVLIICYYWPPAGGPGVQRWLKFVKYLPEFNIHPIVYVPENPNYAFTDASFSTEIPNEVTIIKKPINEPYGFAKFLFKNKTKTLSQGIINEKEKQSLAEKILLYIRGNYFIPDARVAWVKPSLSFLFKYIKENKIETVITTGPPHSMHLIGLKLQEKLQIRWLADFRDPWTTISYHNKLKLTKKSKKKHLALETKVLQNANNIIVTSANTKNNFLNKTTKPITVITNGYDTEKSDKIKLDTKFTISHIGSLLSGRNPDNLWRVLQELTLENSDFAKDLSIQLIGAVSNLVKNSIEKHQLQSFTNYIGYVTHQKAIAYQKASQILLLAEINSEETKCIVPGKLFEYMASGRPIIAIGPEQSDVETIIKQTNTGVYFNYSATTELKDTILNYYKAFKSNELTSNPTGIQQYSRKALTKKLTEIL